MVNNVNVIWYMLKQKERVYLQYMEDGFASMIYNINISDVHILKYRSVTLYGNVYEQRIKNN